MSDGRGDVEAGVVKSGAVSECLLSFLEAIIATGIAIEAPTTRMATVIRAIRRARFMMGLASKTAVCGLRFIWRNDFSPRFFLVGSSCQYHLRKVVRSKKKKQSRREAREHIWRRSAGCEHPETRLRSLDQKFLV